MRTAARRQEAPVRAVIEMQYMCYYVQNSVPQLLWIPFDLLQYVAGSPNC